MSLYIMTYVIYMYIYNITFNLFNIFVIFFYYNILNILKLFFKYCYLYL